MPMPQSVARCNRSSGFTLVELLLVVAIMGLLVALLLPAVQVARESARRVACANNMRQLGLALQSYHGSFRVFPSGSGASPRPRVISTSWHVALLPMLELAPLSDVARQGGITAAVGEIGYRGVPVYRCPSDPVRGNGSEIRSTFDASYVGIQGADRRLERCLYGVAGGFGSPTHAGPLILEIHNTGTLIPQQSCKNLSTRSAPACVPDSGRGPRSWHLLQRHLHILQITTRFSRAEPGFRPRQVTPRLARVLLLSE